MTTLNASIPIRKLAVVLVCVLAVAATGQSIDTPLTPGEPIPEWLIYPYLEQSTPYPLVRDAFKKRYGSDKALWPMELDLPHLEALRSSQENLVDMLSAQSETPGLDAEGRAHMEARARVEQSWLDGMAEDGSLPLFLLRHRAEPAMLDWYFEVVFPARVLLDLPGNQEHADAAKAYLLEWYEVCVQNKEYGKADLLLQTGLLPVDRATELPRLMAARDADASMFYRAFFARLGADPFPPYVLEGGMLLPETHIDHESASVTYASVGRIQRDGGRDGSSFFDDIPPHLLNITLYQATAYHPSEEALQNATVLADTGRLVFLHGVRTVTDHIPYMTSEYRGDVEYLFVMVGRTRMNLTLALQLPVSLQALDLVMYPIPPAILADIHSWLAQAFSEAAAEVFGDEPADLALPESAPPAPTQDAWFRSENIGATGAAVDGLRGLLQDLQQRYDLIAGQVANRRFDLAENNLGHLADQLGRVGEAVTALQKEGKRVEVTFMGLPTDAGMAEIQQLDRERQSNHRLFQHLSQETDKINRLLKSPMQDYITQVWRGMYQSMLDWHAPPAWYQAPQTFLAWHEESKERAAAILAPQEAVLRLRTLGEEFAALRAKALEDHRNILSALEPLEPIRKLDAQARALLRNAHWARWVPDKP